jgi:hypothetical protein
MKRLAGFAALVGLTFAPVACAAVPVPTAKPMIGNTPFPDAVGFGEVKPVSLSFGRTPMVCHIHWDSWGGQIAVGTGVGSAVNPTTYKRTPSAVVIYLYKLETVRGKPAYTGMNFIPVPTHHSRALPAC